MSDWKLVEDRFWSKVKRVPIGCWVWMGSRGLSGYGNLNVGGRRVMSAHRYAYQVTSGEVLTNPKIQVRHSCDNRLCVRPSHLSLGTHDDNMLDMHSRRRFHNNKLTSDDVQYIRSVYRGHHRQYGARPLARKFGVSISAIMRAAIGETFNHKYMAGVK